MSKVVQGQKMVQRLIAEKVLNPQDVGYCILSVDPFHDTVLECNGMPDATMADQITVQAPYQMNFGGPVGGTTPWSFSVVMNPWTDDTVGLPTALGYNMVGSWLQTPNAPFGSQVMPGLTVYRGADGNPLGPFRTGVAGNLAPIGLGLQSVHAKGRNRVLGMAFEVYDTSAVVNKQGTVTCWRQNTNMRSSSYINVTSTTAFLGVGVVDAVPMMRPPETVNEANRLLGTVSWRGEDGCYMVASQNEEFHPAKLPDNCQPLILNQDFTSGPVSLISQQVISGSYNQIPIGISLNSVNTPLNRWNMQPFNQCGAIFTGLNPNSTYMVRYRVIDEREPGVDEAEVALLARRAAGYNPIAMEIRTHCMQYMPVAVKVGDNGFGEYFWKIISNVGPALLGSVNPILGGVGAAAAGLVGIRNEIKAEKAIKKGKAITRTNLPQVNQGPTLVANPVVGPAQWSIQPNPGKKKPPRSRKKKAPPSRRVRDLRDELRREEQRDDARKRGKTRGWRRNSF